MKVLAKIGLIAAAAAVVLFIFIFEFYKPNSSNEAMKAPPEEEVSEYNYYQGTDSEETTIETDTEEVSNETVQEEPTEETLDQESPESLVKEAVQEQLPPEEEEPKVETPPVVEETPAVTKENTDINVRRIYGKITLSSNGEKVAGVNIMIPGSSVAKISNNIGGYTIQVPPNTRELIFIYRGKKLVQRLSPSNNLLNVRLNLETMEYD